ncbi:lipopolysaccharide assembly protein LapA domain-containing protein [Alkalibacillus haloalkaliphilus]|uniref:lipopolysaccharide assembly protein LapA domain-containing protein n=1 Tax=Alkalibacillus haloalkaliphilus TaxID=94136 RepID=UPI0002F13D75|nr:lipopolysaccharide assembly protein LapA domain-containing protein [Alkalibacillus haloalkaliphilus]
MKQQTWIILTIIFTILIAVFAVINVDSVPVDFLFVETEAPLILVILLSVLLGALLVMGVSFAKFYQLQKQIKQLKADPTLEEEPNQELEDQTVLDHENKDEQK